MQAAVFVLGAVMGTPVPASAKLDESAALWKAVEAVFFDSARPWSVGMAKVVVRWIGGERQANREGLAEAVMRAWIGEEGLELVSTAGRVCKLRCRVRAHHAWLLT